MKHAKTMFSTEIFAGAIISMVQYLEALRYTSIRGSSAPISSLIKVSETLSQVEAYTLAALNSEPWCVFKCFFSLS
jgi:hypothetical protein